MAKTRTWLFVGLGCLAVMVGGAARRRRRGSVVLREPHQGGAGAQHGSAERSLAEVRPRFAGQTPLITVDENNAVSTAELQRRRATYSGALPETLHLMAWKQSDDKLIRVSFPFWMLRFQSDKSMRINVDGFRVDHLGVSNEDLQMAGPALVLDLDREHDARDHVDGVGAELPRFAASLPDGYRPSASRPQPLAVSR